MEIKFGENVRRLRTDMGLSQQDLAKKLGTTQRKVSYWENGGTEPDIEQLWKIADFFDITVDELIGRSD